MTDRRRWIGSAACCALLTLAACNNQYGPPPADGQPRNWGQQHYVEVQRWREQGPQWRQD